MKLSIKGLAVASAIVWGGSIFLTGLANLLTPGYGADLLELAASIYPGYELTGRFGSLIVGTLYALLDGAIFGAIFAWLYNRMAGPETAAPARP
jgi:hypothetical protein